ncbi:YicC/YloC family endoribonuclease [Wansuia hejianensis]|uniref:YicC family protein n=1 Tax=Wansuia hejianensis TaxID=2763667 RepID=A0A926EV58_9FIRM|nr:YicC/YloC family endoribonuclease [Wansuia hejianensis]MBC8590448.1 YicC family protein [Wansuia hejianensis]
MIKSMTGYGKGEYENELYRFKIEIKSVNHRYNDISIRMPRHILYLEETIKKAIKEYILRGKVDVFINLEYVNNTAVDIDVDINLARAYKIALEDLKKELGLEDNIRLNNILGVPEIIKMEKKDIDEELILDSLNKSLHIALEEINHMKVSEGKVLKKDILTKLDTIEENLNIIENRAPKIVLEYKSRLSQRIKELLDNNTLLDEDRLNNEVAFFADKSSIDEEIVRIKSHIIQFRSILDEENTVGRKLDFLIQELNREINTIGSKANDETITKQVIELKAELEKIREQIQNIE